MDNSLQPIRQTPRRFYGARFPSEFGSPNVSADGVMSWENGYCCVTKFPLTSEWIPSHDYPWRVIPFTAETKVWFFHDAKTAFKKASRIVRYHLRGQEIDYTRIRFSVACGRTWGKHPCWLPKDHLGFHNNGFSEWSDDKTWLPPGHPLIERTRDLHYRLKQRMVYNYGLALRP